MVKKYYIIDDITGKTTVYKDRYGDKLKYRMMDDIVKIVTMYKDGFTKKEIHKVTKISMVNIKKVLKTNKTKHK